MFSADSLEELDAAPATLAHARGVMSGQPHATKYIDLEEFVPERILDLEKLPRAIDAEIVDQDIRGRLCGDQCVTALGQSRDDTHNAR